MTSNCIISDKFYLGHVRALHGAVEADLVAQEDDLEGVLHGVLRVIVLDLPRLAEVISRLGDVKQAWND